VIRGAPPVTLSLRHGLLSCGTLICDWANSPNSLVVVDTDG